MKEFFESLMCDVDGHKSSKRLITLIAFILVSIAFIIAIFTEVHIEEYMWNGFIMLIGAGLGFVTLEKFSKKK